MFKHKNLFRLSKIGRISSLYVIANGLLDVSAARGTYSSENLCDKIAFGTFYSMGSLSESTNFYRTKLEKAPEISFVILGISNYEHFLYILKVNIFRHFFLLNRHRYPQ